MLAVALGCRWHAPCQVIHWSRDYCPTEWRVKFWVKCSTLRRAQCDRCIHQCAPMQDNLHRQAPKGGARICGGSVGTAGQPYSFQTRRYKNYFESRCSVLACNVRTELQTEGGVWFVPSRKASELSRYQFVWCRVCNDVQCSSNVHTCASRRVKM